jgi:hypothetical protein
MSFPTQGVRIPSFSYIAAAPFQTGKFSQIFIEDSSNNYIYVLANSGSTGDNGQLLGFTVASQIAVPATGCAGPIYTGDFNNDGNIDFIVNGQSCTKLQSGTPQLDNSASIYFGNGDGTFQPPLRLSFDHNVHSMLLQDMDADGIADMVVEGDDGVIEIFHGNGTTANPFARTSEGGISPGLNGFPGDVGHLVAIAMLGTDTNLDILTTNMIGMSVLQGQGMIQGRLSYALKGIYNIGSEATSLGLGHFEGDGNLDLAVGSAEGIALIPGNGDGSFQAPQVNGVQRGAGSRASQAAGGITTTTTLNLCIGPTLSCPSVGGINPPPPFMANLSMSYGQTFNGSAQTSANDGSALTGTIAFNDLYNGVSNTLCTLPAGAAGACPPSVGVTQGTSVGVNVFTAVYSGDSSHAPSSSPTVTITVLQDTNSATLTGAPNPSPFGQPVTFTATLTGNYAAPTGTVTFAELFPPTTTAVQLGTGTLVPSGSGNTSTATFTISTLPIGTDTISVSYAATQDFAAAIATTTEVILPLATTTTTLTSSVNPSAIGLAVTFTATVTATASGGNAAPNPTGTVTFLDGTTLIGTGVLSASGVATLTTSALAVGSHSITASYAGTGAISPSTSPILVQVVTNSSFTLSVTPSTISLGVGDDAGLTVTVTPVAGFNQSVALSCSGLPSESACSFAASTLTPGSYTTVLLLSTTAPHSCGSTQPYFLGGNGSGNGPFSGTAAFGMPALASLAVLFLPGRRRWLRALVAVAVIAGAMQLAACGNCTDLGTRPGTYSFQITGTVSSNSETESEPITVTVTI